MRMLRSLFAIAFVLSFSPAFAGENCTCRYKESDIGEGQTICMRTPNGSQMATCSRVLNNTSWKFLGTPCPVAQVSDPHNMTVFEADKAQKLLDLKKQSS